MKYILLTITFLLIIFLLIGGFFVYVIYEFWIREKHEIISRLSDFRNELKTSGSPPVYLAPNLTKRKSTEVFDGNSRLLGVFRSGKREIVTFDELNPLLVQALLIMEDKKFYFHRGFDLGVTVSGFIEDVKTFSLPKGGSTITQKLARVLCADHRGGYRQKVYALFCTAEIEKRFSKDEIVTLYLNSAYFGHQMYGVENAAEFYFQKAASDLNIFEVALLVGIVSRPERCSPIIHPDRCIKMQKIVLNKLSRYGVIDTESIVEGFERFWADFALKEHTDLFLLSNEREEGASYFLSYVRRALESELGPETLRDGGYKVFTTLDREKDTIAQNVLSAALISQNERIGKTDAGIEHGVEGALVALDPRNGHILSMIGGSGFTARNNFNRAVFAKRQIGSAFKPFVYAAAIEQKGYGPKSVFIDKPLEIDVSEGIWKPANYNDMYYGEVTLEFALKKSLNSVAVQLAQEIGPDCIIELIGKSLDMDMGEAAKRFQPYPSLALGVYSFSPLEIARAFSVFPNRGEKVYPIGITRIKDEEGHVLVDYESGQKKKRAQDDIEDSLRVISEKTADTITHMLSEVLKKGGTAFDAMQEHKITFDAAGKTGTTDNYSDAWFIGYTQTLVVAVWIGFDNPSHSLGQDQTGGIVAAPVWARFMKRAVGEGKKGKTLVEYQQMHVY
jgi:penicillin-binding protein 1A